MAKEVLKIAAVADLHCGRDHGQGSLHPILSYASDNADIVLICGDLTDYGLPEEAELLVKELPRGARGPMLAVFGNHDWESGKTDELCKILRDGGIHLLDGDSYEFGGIGFAGAKGFGGGFGQRMLEPWGEQAIKAYVQESVDEQLKLERALAKSGTEQRVVLLHYAPIQATIEGEPCETFPFLGCGRLEEPINRYNVSVVFHGHAHHGSPRGQTRDGIPVFNVSAPLLRKSNPAQFPVLIYELAFNEPADEPKQVLPANVK
jgi:Icc-related predicted phosphoesterase